MASSASSAKIRFEPAIAFWMLESCSDVRKSGSNVRQIRIMNILIVPTVTRPVLVQAIPKYKTRPIIRYCRKYMVFEKITTLTSA